MHQCCPDFVRNIAQFSVDHPFASAVIIVALAIGAISGFRPRGA